MIKRIFPVTLFAILFCFQVQSQSQAELDATSLTRVYFDHDSAELTQGAQDLIRSLAQDIDLNTFLEVKLTGMTNTIGNMDYNYELAKRRAASVKEFIEKSGGKVDEVQVFGPLATTGNCCECDVNENRRVDITLVDTQILSGIGY